MYMVQALVTISCRTNRILNIVKAKYNLKDKPKAIDIVTKEYGAFLLDPQLRPEYVKKMLKTQKQPAIKVGTIENLRKRYER